MTAFLPTELPLVLLLSELHIRNNQFSDVNPKWLKSPLPTTLLFCHRRHITSYINRQLMDVDEQRLTNF